MYCRQCGKEISGENIVKCPFCQARIGKGRRYCPECGTQNKYNKNFCDECGFDFLGDLSHNNEKISQGSEDIKKVSPPQETVSVQQYEPKIKTQANEGENIGTGNTLADKIIKANEGRSNVFATYGKKQVNSPLMVPKNIEKPKRTDDFSISEPVVSPTRNEKLKEKHENSEYIAPNNEDLKNVTKDNKSDTSKVSNKNSVFCLLYVVFAIASLCTCQLFYAIAMVVFSVADFLKNKNANGLIVSLCTIAFVFASIYFGVSFYMF